MALVNVVNVQVLDNPSPFFNPFQFEITFECMQDLDKDLEWKVIYVGSAESEDYDQVLDTVLVGPVTAGRHMFVFQADPPKPAKIPISDIVGVTVVLLTCSFRGQEFVRVGYYVNNEYTDPELRENPPSSHLFDKLTRNILATDPRVTRFNIEWEEQQKKVVEAVLEPPSDAENIPPGGCLPMVADLDSMPSGGKSLEDMAAAAQEFFNFNSNSMEDSSDAILAP